MPLQNHALRLHWMRETAPGVFRAEVRITEPALLATIIGDTAGCLTIDACALAEKVMLRVAEALKVRPASGPAVFDVQFPPLCHRDWKERVRLMAGWNAEIDGDGRVHVRDSDPQIFGDVRTALASGLPSASTDFPLTFTDRRTVSPFHANFGLPALLRGYNFAAGDIALLEKRRFEAPVEASLTLSLRAECAAGWTAAPGERAGEFFATYARVAKATQAALRRWLPYVVLGDTNAYADRESAAPLVAYQAMRPYRGRPRYCFTHDIRNPVAVDLAYRLAARDIGPLAASVESALREQGRPDLARAYESRRRSDLIDYVRKQRRSMESLLLADGLIADAMVMLGLQGNEIGSLAVKDPAGAAKVLGNACETFEKSCRAILRRVYFAVDFRAFAPMLLIEATRALRPAAPIAATLRIDSGAASYALSNG